VVSSRAHFTEMCSGSEAGSYLRLIDSCITQLKAQGPSSTCNESKRRREEFHPGEPIFLAESGNEITAYNLA